MDRVASVKCRLSFSRLFKTYDTYGNVGTLNDTSHHSISGMVYKKPRVVHDSRMEPYKLGKSISLFFVAYMKNRGSSVPVRVLCADTSSSFGPVGG